MKNDSEWKAPFRGGHFQIEIKGALLIHSLILQN